MSGRGCKYSGDCFGYVYGELIEKSTVWRAVSMQKKRIMHTLAC